ncbi:hypothetical protein AVEN_152308-2-1, partial [Araneus ventricosus]
EALVLKRGRELRKKEESWFRSPGHLGLCDENPVVRKFWGAFYRAIHPRLDYLLFIWSPDLDYLLFIWSPDLDYLLSIWSPDLDYLLFMLGRIDKCAIMATMQTIYMEELLAWHRSHPENIIYLE